MTDKEILEFLEKHDIKCRYCPYDSDCPKGVTCNGGMPSFPACDDDDVNDLIVDDARDVLNSLKSNNLEDLLNE